MLGLSLVAASRGHSSSRCAGLSLSWPLLLRGTGSRRAGSVVVAHGPSCPAACGSFPDQGSNPFPCINRQILNHCATKEAPAGIFLTTAPPRKPLCFVFKFLLGCSDQTETERASLYRRSQWHEGVSPRVVAGVSFWKKQVDS